MLTILEEVLHNIVEYGILLFEFAGVLVLIFGGVEAVIEYFGKSSLTRNHLFHHMEMALNFKLGGEILRTVEVQTSKELLIVVAIFLLRVGMTFLIHWELENTNKSKEESKDGSIELLKKKEQSV